MMKNRHYLLPLTVFDRIQPDFCDRVGSLIYVPGGGQMLCSSLSHPSNSLAITTLTRWSSISF